MRSRALAAALVWMAGAASALASSAPLSAIDWLSESVGSPAPSDTAGVSVAPVAPAPEVLGIIDGSRAGVPPDIWAASRGSEVARLIEGMPADLPLPVRDALADLLSTTAAPPEAEGEDFLLTRIDGLLFLGRLAEADRLIDAAGGASSPELFRRRFDIALLTGRENGACRMMEARPEIAPTYPARIFCLARSGDWPAAALTLRTAQALDVLAETEGAIMTRFLDDGEADHLPPPERPETITPLAFRIYEAIGEPIATRSLPLAFAHADLSPQNGLKTRLEAAERLFRAGAMPADTLIGIYVEQPPAASGGVWDRAAAVRRWVEAGRPADPGPDVVQPLAAAGLARLVVAEPPAQEHALPDEEPAGTPAALLREDRRGEAALAALAQVAAAWDGDPGDVAAAFATLRAAGLETLAGRLAARWTAGT